MSAIAESTLDRLNSDATLAARSGFALKPPVFALGTPVNSTGVDNFNKSRASFESLPIASDALDRLRVRIANEMREDIKVRVPDLAMMRTGMLSTPDHGLIAMEPDAAERLFSLVTPGGGAYLARCPSDLAAVNFNHWMRDPENVNARATLRTRLSDDGSRAVFAAVGPTYAPHDADRVASDLEEFAAFGARADVLTDGYRTRIDVLYHSDIKADLAAAGELFKAGVRVTTADDGTEAVKVKAFVVRNLCRNLIILDEATTAVRRRVHRGTKTMAFDVREAISAASAAVSGFAEQWGRAESDRVMDSGADPRKVFTQLVERGLVKVAGCERDRAIGRLVDAWNREPGYSRRSIINAVTKAAHTFQWGTWGAESLEESAGKLLHCRIVLN